MNSESPSVLMNTELLYSQLTTTILYKAKMYFCWTRSWRRTLNNIKPKLKKPKTLLNVIWRIEYVETWQKQTCWSQNFWRPSTRKIRCRNSAERKEFEAKAKAWYYAELLKDERKRQNVTQKALAEKIGKKREYISSLEKGQTDMQLSTFLRIADALGLRFSLVLG